MTSYNVTLKKQKRHFKYGNLFLAACVKDQVIEHIIMKSHLPTTNGDRLVI